MNVDLIPPPHQYASPIEWGQWFQALWRFVSPQVSTSADVAAEIASGSSYHGVTTLTAPRILTLPATSMVADGDELVIQDESGAAGANTITLSPQGTDVLLGPATIVTNYGRRRLIRRPGKWYSA